MTYSTYESFIYYSFELLIWTFKMADVTITEVRLETLMKEIFKEEFEKHQKNLLNLISGNFDITVTEIKKAQSDINELKESLEHTETVLAEKVATAEKKVEKLQEQINESWDYQVYPERLEFTERKVVELETDHEGITSASME